MNEKELGRYFTKPDGSVWELIGYCELPTATMQKVGTDDQVHFAIGSLVANEFKSIDDGLSDVIRTVAQQAKGE